MITYSTSLGQGYNPFYVSGVRPGKPVSLIPENRQNVILAKINVLVSAGVFILSLLALTTVIDLTAQTWFVASAILVAWVLFSVVSRARRSALIKAQVEKMRFKVSIFTVEWIFLNSSVLLFLSAIRASGIAGFVDTAIFLSSAIVTVFIMLPLFQANLFRMKYPENCE